MKRIYYLLAIGIVLGSCGKQATKGNSDTPPTPAATDAGLSGDSSAYKMHSFLLTSKTLPKQVDLSTDISDMTYAELRVMKNYVYALHGMWFMEQEMNRFFQVKCLDWYEQTCYEYLEAHDWNALVDYDQAELSAEEQAFVDRIDRRLAQMEAQPVVNRDGVALRNPALTVNMFQMEDLDSAFYQRLNRYNFCITPTDMQQLFNVYEMNDYQCMPSFVTTDVYLQAFHMYFSYVLKCLERYEYANRLHQACQFMNSRAMELASQVTDDGQRDLAEYNAAFFAIADRLLTGEEQLTVPESYAEAVAGELSLVAQEKPALSPMMSYRNVYFAYDLFRPRGHYTRTEAQQRYFRAMMWLQTCTFCRESKRSLQYAAMMAFLINSLRQEKKDAGESVYETLQFLMGEPDNVSAFDLADLLVEGDITRMADLTDDGKLLWLDGRLKTLFQSRNRITPKVADSQCTDKINYMPQRYTPDAEVLCAMYDEKPNARHPFPSGLDVFSAFGTDEADHIINKVYDYPSRWAKYRDEATRMKKRFEGYSDWDRSMNNKWMQCLVELQTQEKGQPNYMQTRAWRRKNLNTALASWAELKHDAILYAEQPMAAECGGGSDFPDPILVGYVEPNMPFWTKMQELLALTRSLLEKHGMMDEKLRERTEQLEHYIAFCIDATRKELAGEMLEESDYATIKYLGSSLEWFTLSVVDPDLLLSNWELVQGPDRSVAVVADVFTRNVPDCKKCGILYEATGNADIIYVLVDIGGRTYLTRGATFSYYEFVKPLGERLTDEEWQLQLENGKAPARPEWMQPYLIGKKPSVNETVFYGSGC